MPNATENSGFNEKINNFVQKNRTPIFISLGVIVLVLAGFIVSISVINAVRQKAISAVEDFYSRYETLAPHIAADHVHADADDHDDFEIEELMNELEVFAKKTSGYSGGRAWAIIAAIHSERKEWPEAENAWSNAATTGRKTYLEPIGWYNAGAAAEEMDKNEQAIEYYTKCLNVKSAFPAAVQAKFSIGRLKEITGDREGALEIYRELISDWSYDATWTSLAHSRVAALEAKGQ